MGNYYTFELCNAQDSCGLLAYDDLVHETENLAVIASTLYNNFVGALLEYGDATDIVSNGNVSVNSVSESGSASVSVVSSNSTGGSVVSEQGNAAVVSGTSDNVFAGVISRETGNIQDSVNGNQI